MGDRGGRSVGRTVGSKWAVCCGIFLDLTLAKTKKNSTLIARDFKKGICVCCQNLAIRNLLPLNKHQGISKWWNLHSMVQAKLKAWNYGELKI